MKKLIAVLFILMGSLCSFSQMNIIKMMPAFSQGYLVLNKTANPNVVTWRITITKRVYSGDGTYTDTQVNQFSLSDGLFYKKLPVEYVMNDKTSNHLASIVGLDSRGNILAQSEQRVISAGSGVDAPEGPVGGLPPGGPKCSWTCNGQDYAYTIFVYETISGGAIMTLEPAVDYLDPSGAGVPYYRYFDLSSMLAYCNNSSMAWMGYGPSFGSNCSGPYYNNDVIGPLDGNSTVYYDINGTRIWGNVYGVRKGLGPWRGQNIYSNPMADWSQLCGLDFVSAMGIINNQSNLHDVPGNLPDLICTPAFGGGSTEPNGSDDCLDITLDDFFINDEGDSVSWSFDQAYQAWLQALTDCWRDHNYHGAPVGIQVGDLSLDNTGTSYNVNEVLSGAVSVNLSPGLYNTGVSFSDGFYLPLMVEVPSSTSTTTSANNLDVTVYPVPIVNNSFNLLLTAHADLQFSYQLTDAYGYTLHTENISLNKNTTLDKSINPEAALTHGLLVHRFIFQDGSVKNIMTFKE